MPTTHPRRILKHSVLALAVVVSLMLWYVASFGAWHWYLGRWYANRTADPPKWVADAADLLHRPLYAYDDRGKTIVSAFALWCEMQGMGSPISWSEAMRSRDHE